MHLKFKLVNILLACALALGLVGFWPREAKANNTAQPLPLSQNWGNNSLITVDDNWDNVPGIIGYLGDYNTTASPTGVDPQTLLLDYPAVQVDVIANRADVTITNGGVAEFDGITNRVVAMQGSGTADAPFLLINISTTGFQNVNVSYLVRDIDTTADNAAQQVALHYRVGNTGDFTNVPSAYIADATVASGTKDTPVSVVLPANANNQSLVQLRVMTTNAAGSDEWVGIDDIAITGEVYAGDAAPAVASTTPANGANAQKTDDIVITFSEAVTLADSWFSISCSLSGAHTAAVSGTTPTFTLDPDADFTSGETCTVTIDASKVTDVDTDDPPDNMAVNYVFSFNVLTGCGDTFTPIYDIQGSTDITPFKDQVVSTEGVVAGDFQSLTTPDSGNLNGFFIRDITGDGNAATSDGIFAYYTPVDVQVGQIVRVTGKIIEYNGLTEINPIIQVLVCGTGTPPAPIEVQMPLADPLFLERYEGMLVTFPQTLTISEYFNYDRYGHIVLTNGRFMNFTAVNEPDVTNFAADTLNFKNNSIKLDDGLSSQNPAALRHPDGTTFTKDHYFRGGDTVSGVTGFLDFYTADGYRVQPIAPAVYTAVGARETIAELDLLPGDLRVVSFNVLNYFVTLDGGTSAWICGPSGTMECRGADSTLEFDRQRAKLLDALITIDADIFGLMEIENEHVGGGDAVADLVAGLNLALGDGTYAYIQTGAIGTDAIKQAILYKPAVVTPVGSFEILDSSVDTRFIDTANRPVLAQVFASTEGGNPFVVAVNHLKSKGSPCTGDPDVFDGSGTCNLTREAAAKALVDWLADPAVFPGIEKTLIIGDLNSYDKEAPIDAIKLGADDLADTGDDYLDLIFENQGELAYGYVFDGRSGYMDHGLANLAMAENVVDTNLWHINADESDVFDYNADSFKPEAQRALYSVDPYRTSDHDPVLISLDVFTLEEQITAAVDYVYSPVYNYVGVVDFDDPNNIFTAYYTTAQVAAKGPVYDLARYLGALYRQHDASVSSIEFNDVMYTWDLTGILQGSNWEDSSGNTLVSAMVLYYFSAEYDPMVGLPVIVYDEVTSSTVKFFLIDEAAALAWLQANTVLSSESGTIADLKATFPAEIPPNIVSEPFVIDSRMTLAEALPTGSTVTIYREGVAVLTDITLDGAGPFWFTELFTPDAPRYPFDAIYSGAVENYVIEVTGPGGNPLAFDTTVLIESVISKDGYSTETVLDDITLDVNIPADETAALAWLQANTVLSSVSGTIADLKATFPASIPPVIVGLPYVIDSRMTLAEALPTGSTVTIYREGVAVLTDITLTGVGPFWFTELFEPDPAPRANFDAGYGNAEENYVIVVTGPGDNPLDFDTAVLIESVISKDSFETETVLDDITLAVHIDDAVAPAVASGLAKSASDGDVAWADGQFTVDEGYVVDTIEITMDEAVLVDLGTIVTMVDHGPYGTVTAHDGALITVTPYAGNEIASVVGVYTYTVPTGSVTDLRGNAFIGSITLEVLNVAPVAVNDTFIVAEDTLLSISAPGVLANDQDFDPSIITAVLVTGPASGIFTLNPDGSFDFTPALNFVGEVTFTYKANDGLADSNEATVTITVTPVNDEPTAEDDAYSVDEDSVLSIATPGVLGNDIEVDGDNTIATLVTNVTHGTLVLLGNGSFTYTPAPDYNGPDSFVYRLITYPATQADAWTDEATVFITVNPINDAPVALGESYSTEEDVPLTVAVADGVLLNDTDIDVGDTLTAVLVDSPLHGTVNLGLDGSFLYTPAANYNGPDSFTYYAFDNLAESNVVTVTLTINPVNDAPVAVDDAYNTPEDTELVVPAPGVLANDTDADGETLSVVSVVTEPAHGVLALNADGSFTYMPEENFFGSDTFTYKVADGTGLFDEAVVTIQVGGVNDWPVANDDTYETTAGVTLDIVAPGVLANDVQLDPNESVTLDVLVQPAHGTLTLINDGSFTYVPEPGFMGVDTFEYQLNSTVMLQGEFSDTAIVTITVNPSARLFLPLIMR